MDDKTDIEISIAKLKYLEDNAKFKIGERVHTFIDNKVAIGIVDDRRFDDNDNIYYDVRLSPSRVITLGEWALVSAEALPFNRSKFAKSNANFPF